MLPHARGPRENIASGRRCGLRGRGGSDRIPPAPGGLPVEGEGRGPPGGGPRPRFHFRCARRISASEEPAGGRPFERRVRRRSRVRRTSWSVFQDGSKRTRRRAGENPAVSLREGIRRSDPRDGPRPPPREGGAGTLGRSLRGEGDGGGASLVSSWFRGPSIAPTRGGIVDVACVTGISGGIEGRSPVGGGRRDRGSLSAVDPRPEGEAGGGGSRFDSLSTISGRSNPLSRVLCSFPSRYLWRIGLSLLSSLG